MHSWRAACQYQERACQNPATSLLRSNLEAPKCWHKPDEGDCKTTAAAKFALKLL